MPFEHRQIDYFRLRKCGGVRGMGNDLQRPLRFGFEAYTAGAPGPESMKQELGHFGLKSGVNLVEQVI